MYLLRKLGIPLVAVLILSILALSAVVLVYRQRGLMLPSFDHSGNNDKWEQSEGTADTTSELEAIDHDIDHKDSNALFYN